MKQTLSVKEYSRLEKRRKAMERDHMIEWDFEHDNGENPKALEVAKKFVDEFPTLRQNGTGLFIFGSAGSGKSFMAAEIVNALTDLGHKCYLTTLLGLCNELENRTGEMRARFLERLFCLELLVLEDFGMQADTPLNRQRLLYIVRTCQQLRILLIFTTAYSLETLMKTGGGGENKKPPELMTNIRRCTLDFTMQMPPTRRNRMLQQRRQSKRMLNVTEPVAPVQQTLPLEEK